MGKVNIILNGKEVQVDENLSIMQAAKQQGIILPSLCYHEDQTVRANCRVCVVEVEGASNLMPSCSTKVCEGMNISTNSPRVRKSVKTILELILADHPQECLTCIRGGNCDLRKLADRYGLTNIQATQTNTDMPLDKSTPTLVRDPNKCIKCGKCAEVCHATQELEILYSQNRSIDICVAPEYGKKLSEVDCVQCGQCALVCPVGAIYEKDNIEQVWDALALEGKHVVVAVAPSVRVGISEEFGMDPGSIATGKLVSALRGLGFARVFDTNFAADLTIIEEGNELLHRIKNGGVLPMMTSCCPGWINYAERYYPEMLPHLSSCKSPQQMFGAVAKSYYAKASNIDPKDIIVVSVMPCVTKKYEAAREEMNDSGYQDIDIVLTIRELARMLKSTGVDFNALQDDRFDNPLGESTGAAVIFGATGGVMEAAVRTVYEVVTGETLEALDFEEMRGMEEGMKSATLNLAGTEVKVGIAHTLGNAKKMMELVKEGESGYAFIEVMCCPGGCIGGGGQPYTTTNAVRKERIKALYKADAGMPLRKSHENPDITKIYEKFLKEPLGHESHKLLHTTYTDRSS